MEEPSTIPFYTLIDTPRKVLVASDNTSLTGIESDIIPREHKVESIDTGNNDRKNITDNEDNKNKTQGTSNHNGKRESKIQGNLGTWLNLGETIDSK